MRERRLMVRITLAGRCPTGSREGGGESRLAVVVFRGVRRMVRAVVFTDTRNWRGKKENSHCVWLNRAYLRGPAAMVRKEVLV